MPWIKIGNCGHSTTPGDTFEFQLGIEYLKLVCGEVPEGCELGIMREEFDGMGIGEVVDLPSGIGLCWDDTEITNAPWKYISQCETALRTFHEAVNWYDIHPEAVNRSLSKTADSRTPRTRRREP
jgi:hypothetical protein